MEASLHALAELSGKEDECASALQRQLDQLDYEVQRAFEQYNEVDPRNRLVASELERRWNAKLEEADNVRERLTELAKEAPKVSADDRAKILKMGEAFEGVWQSEECPGEFRKKIACTIIEEIIAKDLDDHTLHFLVHWKGGVHTGFTMEKPSMTTTYKTSLASLEIIRKMAVRYGDDQITSVLNQLGHSTGKGKRWSETKAL